MPEAKRNLLISFFNKFKRFISTPPKERRGKGVRTAYRFTTKSLPCFTRIYNLFFRDRKKIVPKNLKLTGRILAFWFMGDGSKSWKSVYLNTQKFSSREQFFLQKRLRKDLGIKSTLNKDKIYFRLRIRLESMERFQELVRPYLLPSFSYKLP